MLELPDLTRVNAADPDAAHRITTSLERQGVAMFTGVRDRAGLLRLGHALMQIRTHRDSDPDGITAIEQRITRNAAGSLAGFTDRELMPHTDGSAVAEPPRLLMLACMRAPHTGGRIVLADGRSIYHDIAESDPAMLDALRTPRSVFFGGASGHLGSVFTETPDHTVTVRLRFDELINYSPTVAGYQNTLRDIVRRNEIIVDLAPCDGYVLLNDWWLHGRTQFTGDRLMLRLIGDPSPDTYRPPGFPTSNRPLAPARP
jgi:alpha-ketoglutarate-dependent taurine dioxygenase